MSGAFKPGDVVQLKSGGPSMTVLPSKEGEVSTVWYNADNREYATATFSPEVLTPKS